MRLTRKWPEGAAVAALRDIDAVSHKSTGQRADELISVSLGWIEPGQPMGKVEEVYDMK